MPTKHLVVYFAAKKKKKRKEEVSKQYLIIPKTRKIREKQTHSKLKG